jgi:hypothetical protein
MTAARVTNLYDLMDAAYDDAAIRQHSRNLGHVPIIDVNPRAAAGLKQELAQEAKGLSLNKCFIRPTFEAGTYSSIRRGRRRGEC